MEMRTRQDPLHLRSLQASDEISLESSEGSDSNQSEIRQLSSPNHRFTADPMIANAPLRNQYDDSCLSDSEQEGLAADYDSELVRGDSLEQLVVIGKAEYLELVTSRSHLERLPERNGNLYLHDSTQDITYLIPAQELYPPISLS